MQVLKNNSVLFTDWIFKNNSAVQGTIFVIESESFVKCINWTFMNNFGITNIFVFIYFLIFKITLVMTVLNGYFEFYNSSIYNNYAVSNPVGELLDSANLWIMSNVTIYNNQALTINAINSEFNTKWDILWFVPANFINYVNNSKNVFSIVINTSLIQLILSSLTIQNSSVISNEEIFFDCFISSLTIKDSQVKNISSSIRASQSNITLANTVVSEIENNSDLGFVFANLNSIIDISSTSFVNSRSCFIIATDSKVKLSAISLSNVTGNSNLIRIHSWNGILISNLSVENWLSSSSTIYLEKSSNVNLSKLSGAQINNLFMTSYKSNITLIDSFWIDSWLQFLEIKSSSIQLLSNSNFKNNGGKTLMDGGAIWITNSIVNIANSYFFNNSAITGGAISFEWTSLKNWNLSITHSTFLSNTGVSKGGAIYYSYNRPVINNVTFINNSAEYGANFASYAYQIRFIDSKNDIMQLSDLVSGVEYNKTLQLSLIDFDSQIMILENVNQIVISSVNITQASVKGINTALLRNGVASFTNFIAIAEPGSTNVLLKASSNALDIRKINEVYNSSSNNIIISSFRFWKPGEVRLEDKTCAVWSPGTFSLTWNSTVWEQCVKNADWRGGNQIYVDPGYWRNSHNTSTIVKCINNEACNGGFVDQELRTVDCAIGYAGILWNDWEIINGTKYEKVSDNKWSKWPSQILNTIRVIGLSLLLFTFILCIISINIKKTKESEISILLRVFTNYLQMTASMMAFSINYPSSILQIFSPFSEIGSTDVFLSFDWFVSDYDIKGPFSSNKIFKIFLTAILPLVLLLVFVIIWVGLRILWKRLIPDLSRSITISFITIIFLLHPRLVQSSIAMFEWVTIDNNDRRVKVDLQESWFSISHIKWIFAIAVPILIVWVFSMPLIAILLLLINYNKSEDNKVKQYFLILYQGLRKEIFYWEFINTLRKSSILIVFTLISSLNVPLKIAIWGMFLVFSIRIQMQIKPYTRQENNTIEIWSVATGSLTMMAGIIFEQGNQYAVFNTIWLLFIIWVNIIFLLEWLYRLSVWIQSSYKRFYIVSLSHI